MPETRLDGLSVDNGWVTDATTESLLVPKGARVLHIGSPKTGSTALQAAMHSKREEMRRHGVLHVASDQRGREAVLAAMMNAEFGEQSDPRLFKRWRTLVAEIEQAGDPRVCLSNESLSRIDDAAAARMVAALGGDRAHIVTVARRLDKLLPSQWQEWVRVGTTSLTYEDWLRVVLEDNPENRHWRDFWLPHDLERLVDRWAGLTGRDRFTLVIADESDRRFLSRTFERLLGLPDGLLQPEETHRTNPSASMPRVETVRRLNAALEEQDWPADIKATLRSRVAKRIRSAAPWPGEAPIPLMPAWAAAQVSELNKQREDLAGSLGVQVVGDPANLGRRVPAVEEADAAAEMVSTELAVQSIVTAIGGAVELLEQERSRNECATVQPRRKISQGKSAPSGRSLDQYAAGDLARELRKRATRRLPGRG